MRQRDPQLKVSRNQVTQSSSQDQTRPDPTIYEEGFAELVIIEEKAANKTGAEEQLANDFTACDALESPEPAPCVRNCFQGECKVLLQPFIHDKMHALCCKYAPIESSLLSATQVPRRSQQEARLGPLHGRCQGAQEEVCRVQNSSKHSRHRC